MPEARIEIAAPRLFRNGSILLIWAYGILLLFPVFLSFLVISLIRPGFFTLAIPLATLAVTAWFVPLGQGNSYIARRAKPLATNERNDFLVQVSLTPRLRTGLRATLEDADDFGFLSFNSEGFVFRGDSVQICVPYENIVQVQRQNVGIRGLFVCGARIYVEVNGLANAQFLEFAERSSALVPKSRKITRELLDRFERAMTSARPSLQAAA